jgi:hypothetical protein
MMIFKIADRRLVAGKAYLDNGKGEHKTDVQVV